MCLVVDYVDHDGQVPGQADQAGGAGDAVRAKLRRRGTNRGAGETGPEPLEERTRQRRVPTPVGLTEKDANEELIAVQNAHRFFPFSGQALRGRPPARAIRP